MKTKEELIVLKNGYQELNKKFAELSEEEMKEVNGGGLGELIFEMEEIVNIGSRKESVK